MMLKILHDRLVRLGRDEDGVALVVTLGVFMFLYIACASVYAVGMAVKEKMHLQGACDAAAYSAAIVQADTFSRIATINRAMSWTYQQLTRRQMDYIVWQWLEETREHYDDDVAAAKKYVEEHLSDGCPNRGILKEIGWGVVGNSIRFNNHDDKTRTRDRLVELCGGDCFGKHLNDHKESFYSQQSVNLLGDKDTCGLGKQIDDDLKNIRDMSIAVEKLANDLPAHVSEAVAGILAANVPSYMTDGDCQYFIKQNLNPLDSDNGYFKRFKNAPHDELVFLSFGDKIYQDPEDALGKGANSWFDLDKVEGDVGFHRHYPKDRSESPLVANWNWWAIDWQCYTDADGDHYDERANVASRGECTHGHEKCQCSDGEQHSIPFLYRSSSGVVMAPGATVLATCRPNNDHEDYGYDRRFEGILEGEKEPVRAKPLKLTSAYFGKAGTITVGLARRNENPWFSIFGRVTGGMYSAFSPIADSWTYCFASAKAGYKLYHQPEDWYIDAHVGNNRRTRKITDWEEKLNGNVRVEDGPRDYCIDWKPEESKFAGWYNTTDRRGRAVQVQEWTVVDDLYPTWRQSWNLVQDDWDAVMVPVRQAGSDAWEADKWKEEHAQDWTDYWNGWLRAIQGRRRGYEYAKDLYPDRYEAAWQDQDSGYLASLVNDADWQVLSGSGTPNTSVTAGPSEGDAGDTLNGRLAGDVWEDHWKRGGSSPTATGTSQWNIGSPGANLDWNQIGDEMYH